MQIAKQLIAQVLCEAVDIAIVATSSNGLWTWRMLQHPSEFLGGRFYKYVTSESGDACGIAIIWVNLKSLAASLDSGEDLDWFGETWPVPFTDREGSQDKYPIVGKIKAAIYRSKSPHKQLFTDPRAGKLEQISQQEANEMLWL